MPGFQPQSAKDWCAAHPDAVEFYEPTGYRRIPLTTCVGGSEFDKAPQSEACQGHEEEYERRHRGPSGVAIFFAVVIPFALAGAIGWYVWRNWSTSFGQIRLGEQGAGAVRLGGGGGGALLDEDRPWIRYPVIALSAVVAVAVAMPLVATALWRTARGAVERWTGGGGAWTRLGGGGGGRRFTTRDSFARGRGDYAIVDEDEGELLGDASDEEV